MTLQLLNSEFPYTWGKFNFIFYQCAFQTLPYSALQRKSQFMYCYSGNSAAIYRDPGEVFIFPPVEQADRSWEYINRSQTHECGNLDWDLDIPILGIFVSKFLYFVFAVCVITAIFELFFLLDQCAWQQQLRAYDWGGRRGRGGGGGGGRRGGGVSGGGAGRGRATLRTRTPPAAHWRADAQRMSNWYLLKGPSGQISATISRLNF